MNQNANNGLEIAALVLGIISIPMACWHATIGLIIAIVGIVLSVKARKISRTPMATAGFVCSIIGCAFGVLNLLAGLLLVMFAISL